MGDASVKVTVVDAASERLKNMAREFKEVAKVAKSFGDGESAAALTRAAKGVGQVAGNFTLAEKEAKRASNTFAALKDGIKSFGSGAGLGGPMAMLGLGGVTAFAATAGAIVANSVRLAVEFNRVSTMSTFAMTTNSNNLLSNLASFKAQAYKMVDLGFSANTVAKYAGTYGMARGQMPNSAAVRAIGTYAAAYGQDPTQLAALTGTFGQYSRGTAGSDLGQLFGAASQSGDAGRRISEFIGVATSVLARIQGNAPGGNSYAQTREALREVSGVAGMGGYYATSGGLQTTLGGFNALSNNLTSPANASLAFAAGLSPIEMMRGTKDPAALDKLRNYVFSSAKRIGGGSMDTQEAVALSMFQQLGLNSDQANALWGTRGKSIVGKDGKVNAAGRAALYENSDAGQAAKAIAELENAQTKIGETLIHAFAKPVADFAAAVMNFVTGVTPLNDTLKTIFGIKSVDPIPQSKATYNATWGVIDSVKSWFAPSENQRIKNTSGVIGQYATQFGIDPALLGGIIGTESGWGAHMGTNPKSGAVGAGQVIPSFFPWFDAKRAATDRDYGIYASARILGDLKKSHPGATSAQLASLYHYPAAGGDPRRDPYDKGDAQRGQSGYVATVGAFAQEYATVNGMRLKMTVQVVGHDNTKGSTTTRRAKG